MLIFVLHAIISTRSYYPGLLRLVLCARRQGFSTRLHQRHNRFPIICHVFSASIAKPTNDFHSFEATAKALSERNYDSKIVFPPCHRVLEYRMIRACYPCQFEVAELDYLCPVTKTLFEVCGRDKEAILMHACTRVKQTWTKTWTIYTHEKERHDTLALKWEWISIPSHVHEQGSGNRFQADLRQGRNTSREERVPRDTMSRARVGPAASHHRFSKGGGGYCCLCL